MYITSIDSFILLCLVDKIVGFNSFSSVWYSFVSDALQWKIFLFYFRKHWHRLTFNHISRFTYKKFIHYIFSFSNSWKFDVGKYPKVSISNEFHFDRFFSFFYFAFYVPLNFLLFPQFKVSIECTIYLNGNFIAYYVQLHRRQLNGTFKNVQF